MPPEVSALRLDLADDQTQHLLLLTAIMFSTLSANFWIPTFLLNLYNTPVEPTYSHKKKTGLCQCQKMTLFFVFKQTTYFLDTHIKNFQETSE